MTINVYTNFRVAYNSPDHLKPEGTKNDNHTSLVFINAMHGILSKQFSGQQSFLDLGCSGGQLVADFKDKGYISVGLEGSDYSLVHRRANWATLANTNLFTCDITRPFQITNNTLNLRFNLITMWDVIEHIKTDELDKVFLNIKNHLKGYFMATTSDESVIRDGLELHQTRWDEAHWKKYIAENQKWLVPVDLGVSPVRWNTSSGRGFLTYYIREVKK